MNGVCLSPRPSTCPVCVPSTCVSRGVGFPLPCRVLRARQGVCGGAGLVGESEEAPGRRRVPEEGGDTAGAARGHVVERPPAGGLRKALGFGLSEELGAVLQTVRRVSSQSDGVRSRIYSAHLRAPAPPARLPAGLGGGRGGRWASRNLWCFLSSRRVHYKDVHRLLRCIAPPAGLGRNCPRRAAYKVCPSRASLCSSCPTRCHGTRPAWCGHDWHPSPPPPPTP